MNTVCLFKTNEECLQSGRNLQNIVLLNSENDEGDKHYLHKSFFLNYH